MAKEFFTVDCETDPFKLGRVPKPFIWGVYNGSTGEYHEFENGDELVKFMRVRDAIFYAHNGGKFDFIFLGEHIQRNKKILMINSRLVKAKIGKAEIRDSYALLPFPLAAYKKDDFDYSKMESEVRHLYMDEIKTYLKADCVYLWDLIAAFFAEYGRHTTAPSAAIKMLQKIENIKIDDGGRFFFSEFQKHYFGGRCECFKAGSYKNKKINYFDLNSAYADAMQHKHPVGIEFEFFHKKNPKIIPQGFYTVRARSYGTLCRREKGKIIFDWDGESRIYHTTGHELIAGLEMNKLVVEEHIEQKIFKRHRSFKKFIDHFWGIRQSSKKGSPENLFAKLMMNSAYGKFSANPENYDTFVLFDPAISEYLVDNDWELRGEIGPHVIASKPIDIEEMRFYNVATGASITGYVRAVLMKAIFSVENPIYCDTDSIIFTGKHTIELSDELGAWGDEKEGGYCEGYFAGKKLYALKAKDGEVKTSHKGARLDFDEIKKITEGEIVKYSQEAPSFSWYKEPTFLERNIRRTA